MKARAATYADVAHVLANLSKITADEMSAISRTHWQSLGVAKACKKGGGLDCLFLDYQNPLAIFGSIPKTDHPAIHRTWFIASQEYFDLGAKAVLGSMRFMNGVARNNPRITFEAVTASGHPHLNRWFAHMGFKLKEQFENISLFERLPPASLSGPARLDVA